jgi:hypothetical protein
LYGIGLFAQPANDECLGAINLSLSTPAQCPNTSAVTNSFNSANVNATPISPYPALTGCIGGAIQGPAAEVWYTFIATGGNTEIQITGALDNPNMVLLSGANCNFLFPIACASGGSGLTMMGATTPGSRYYLMVSGGDIDDQGAFTLRFRSSRNCQLCYQPGTVTVAYNPPPINGTYYEGQTVQVCVTVNEWNGNAAGTIEWLHAVQFEFGDNWDVNSVIPSDIPSCDGRGSWSWYESWTSCNTGQTFGPGFAYDSSAGIGCGGLPNDGDPGNNWGDGEGECSNIPGQSPPVTFCFFIDVNDCPPAVTGGSLDLSVQIFSDGDSGSWSQTGCNSGQGASFLASAICCDDEDPIVHTTCPGASDGALIISGNGGLDSTQRFHYILLSEDSMVVYECANCAATIDIPNLLPAGIYNLTATNIETSCSRSTLITLQEEPPTFLSATLCTGASYVFQGDTLTEAGVYWDTLTTAGGCDSLLSLNLSFVAFFSIPLEASICEGESYAFAGQLLQLSGTYTDTLTAVGGCDSIQVLTLDVKEQPSTLLTPAICAGDTLFFDSDTLTATGAYIYTYPAANGCDSLVTLALSVLDNPLTLLTESICEGESYTFDGQQLTQSGAYSALYTAANGCDSLVTLELTVLDNPLTLLTESICEGESYTFDGQQLTQSGTYSALYTAANGCDSLVTLELTVLDNPLTLLTESICEGSSYTFDGQQLTQSGAYSALYTAANGCDSLVTLELTVLLFGDSTHLSEVICAGESYDFQGTILSESGQYEAVLPAANGCDSLVTLALSVLPTYHTTLNESICEGYSFSYNGEELLEAGVYEYAFTAANGCDSLVTLNIEVLPLANALYFIEQCVGTSYFFDGQDLTESGIYTSLGIAANGCDSLAILELTFVTEFVMPGTASICAGESYNFQGQSLTETGLYTDTLTAVGGCDSILLLQLSVLPASSTTLNTSICAGQTLDFNGQSLTEAGIYTATLTNAAGCDSLVTLNLSVIAPVTTSLAATICQDEGYPFDGALLTESGEYMDTLTAASGCDSIVTLQLTVIPTTFTTLSETICAGESVVYQGESLSETGAYQFVLSSSQGCDSVVTFNLTVLPPAQSDLQITTCSPIVFADGQVLTTSGIYTFVLPGEAASGCDSVVVLDLSIIQLPTTTISADICLGETYDFNGVSISDPGQYQFTLQSSAGCDSVVVLSLTVNVINTGITLSNNVLEAQAPNAAYQWIDCLGNTPIPGATASTYAPDATGLYAVVVTQDGCTATSACTEVIVVSASNLLPAEAQWQLQPNPAQNSASLIFESATTAPLDLSIYDATGRLLSRRAIASATERLDLDLSAWPDGIFFIRLAHQAEVSTKRLLKAAQ